MSLLKLYLWKEWRENRMVLFFLALGLLLVTLLVSASLDWRSVPTGGHYIWVTVISIGTTVLTVGSDLFAAERRGTQLQFLERMPAGLNVAFQGKLVFFLSLLGGSLLYGFVLASLMVILQGEPLSFPLSALKPEGNRALASLFVGCLWVFAVSSWVKTSVFAVPFTVLLGGVLICPAVILPQYLWIDYSIPYEWFYPFLFGLGCAAFLGARSSFVASGSHARPVGRAVGRCFGFALLGFTPLYASLVGPLIEWTEQPYEIEAAALCEDQGMGFLELKRRPKFRFWSEGQPAFRNPDPSGRPKVTFWFPSVLQLDLRTGEHHFEGHQGTTVLARSAPWSKFLGHEQQLVGLVNLQAPDAKPKGRNRFTFKLKAYDLRTGMATEHDRLDLRSPLHFNPADFGVESFPAEPNFYPSGFGYSGSLLWSSMFHPTYFRTADGCRAMKTELCGVGTVRVLRDGFLVKEDGVWKLYDPEAELGREPTALTEGDSPCALLSDGSFLVVGQDFELLLVDEFIERREPIVDGDSGEPLKGARIRFLESSNPDRTPIDIAQPLVIALEQGFDSVLALLDLEQRTVVRTSFHVGYEPVFVHCEGTEVILIERGTQLVQYDLLSNVREVLFDVSDL